MVYVVRPTEFELEFDDEFKSLNDAHIIMQGLSIEEAVELDPYLTGVPRGPFLDEESRKKVEKLYAEFLKRLISWEMIDEKGKDIPKTVKGMCRLPSEVTSAMIRTWVNRVVGISPKSETPSSNGESPETESLTGIPMESA